MAEHAIEAEGIRKAFGEQEVLRGIDLRVPEGSITMLVGRSGSGKTVLLKCLAGLLDCDAGTVKLFGEPQRSGRRRDTGVLSYLFQHNALLDSLTAEENVALPLVETTRMPKAEVRRKVGELFEKLDLADMAGKYPGDLSGGMQRRVALARSLILAPKIVLFDEPTTGLDPIRRNGVLEMIVDYRERFGFTAVVVTHDLPGSLLVADHLGLLEKGELVFNGPISEVGGEGRGGTMDRFLNHEEGLSDRILEVAPASDLAEDFPELSATYQQVFSVGVSAAGDDPIGLRLSFPVAASSALASVRDGGVPVSRLYRAAGGKLIGFADASSAQWDEATSAALPVPPAGSSGYSLRSAQVAQGAGLEDTLKGIETAAVRPWHSP